MLQIRKFNIYSQIFLSGALISACQTDTDREPGQYDSDGDSPNILCITCEDISPKIGCFGDSVAHTPNIDKLAEEGIRFTNVFSVSGVCAPSRAALITGMYPSSIGANNMRTGANYLPNGIPPYEAVPPPEVKCYTEYLRAKGYYCTNNVKTDYQFKSPITAWDDCSTEAHWRNRPKDRPFFSIINLMTSHESQVWDRANDPVAIKPEDVSVPPYYADTPTARRDIARVYSNITIMDREVGEIIAQLEEDGLKDETIIIFYSDHGGPLPRQKREIYDSGLKVPMVIRFPGSKHAGKTNDDLISFVDIPPTILSLADIEAPIYMHGQAFLGSYKTQPREYIFAARDRMDRQYDIRRAVRDKQFKYIRNYKPEVGCYQDIKFRKQGLDIMKELLLLRDAGELNDQQMYWFREKKEPEELYDITQDPHELYNLAEQPEYQSTLEDMRKVHESWMRDIDDKGLMTEKELVWSMWPNGNQPFTENPIISNKDGEVAISCRTEGASIAYQINGKGYNPDHWFLYTGPFTANKGDIITSTAIRIGYKQSEVIDLYVR
jgi:N-sulfoglucosamine sulfohydrolase